MGGSRCHEILMEEIRMVKSILAAACCLITVVCVATTAALLKMRYEDRLLD